MNGTVQLFLALLAVSIGSCSVQIQTSRLRLRSPSELQGRAVSPGEIEISFLDNSSDEIGFEVERIFQTTATRFNIAAGTSARSIYIDSSLTPNTKYTYRVRAFDALHFSAYSNRVEISTPGTSQTPRTPSGLSATAASSSEIAVSFFDNSENETGFILERRRRGESIFTEIARLNPSAGSQSKVDYLDRGLSSAIYEYRVRAYNNLGQSSPSNISSAAPSNNGSSGAVTIRMIRYFDTWAANIIKSTDVAGITYHKPSGHLFLSDSEIEEIPSLFKGVNVFEINSLGNTVFREIQTNNIEPTGITFNEVDSYFYVSNDDQRTITRYNASFSAPLKVVSTLSNPSPANDPEDITSDPVTGQLYLVDGVGGKRQVVVYDKDINYQRSFSVADRVADGEGIAFHPISRNLFITSSPSHIYEYTTTGTFIAEYSIASFSPTPTSGMQGLTLAPSSNPNDDPQTLSLYIVDAGVDNAPDGRVYEAELVNY